MARKHGTTQMITFLAGAVIGLVMMIFPLGYFSVSHQHMIGTLEAEARIAANSVTQLISANPLMWEQQESTLKELLILSGLKQGEEMLRLLNTRGEVVCELSDPLKSPVIKTSHVLLDSGAAVGKIEMSRSLRPLLIKSALLLLLALSMGMGAFFILRVLPIRSILRAEEALRRSEEEARQLAQENAAIAEIGLIISSSSDINEVYERFADQVNKLISFDRIVINMIDIQESTVVNVYMAGKGIAGRKVGETYPLKGSGNAEMVRTKSTLVIQTEDFSGYQDRFPMLLSTFQAGFRSILNVPLFSKGRIVGGLLLRSYRPYAYRDKDVRLAERVGGQIAGTIVNARLFAEQKRAEEALRQSEEAIRTSHDELEKRVEERTRELASANQQLKSEIQERWTAQAEALRAKEAAERANRAKSEFLANMSHELRTPLNHIIGFTELIVDKTFGELSSTQEEYLKDVLTSSRHLLSLINDILDLSKIEAGKVELELGEVDLRALVESSVMMVKEKATKHGIILKVEMDRIPESVSVDERKLKQVMYNLLSNAVKFTPDGGKVGIYGEDVEGKSVKVTVKDTGIGIAAEDLERIFKPFEQGDNTASRRYEGTGLGLTLTKRFVELHGGKVSVESEGVGRGSSFSFVIPVRKGVPLQFS
jgi:signal transduction histidine kinase